MEGHYVLRKSFGPLSAGTRLDVLAHPDWRVKERKRRGQRTNEHGYATVRLANISRKLREQLQAHPVHHQLLRTWDIEADMLVKLRRRS